jgi:AbrB family looped-hinge helix DNA binding protein
VHGPFVWNSLFIISRGVNRDLFQTNWIASGKGMFHTQGMRVTIDKAGRIVVPKEIRERLGLNANRELEVLDHPDGLLLRVREARPSVMRPSMMIRINGLLVHHGCAEIGADFNRVVEDAREERIQSVIRSEP